MILDDNFFILKFNSEALATTEPDEDGFEEAFDVDQEVIESVVSAHWLSECFVFTTPTNKLNYCLGGKVLSLRNLDKKMFILGYIPPQSRIYLIDGDFNLISYEIMLSFIEYQIAVVREDFDKAEEIFPTIPEAYHNKCARFLDGLGYKEEALAVTNDREHRFELSLQLNLLDDAYALAESETNDPDQKWKQVSDLALLSGEFAIAESCM